MQLALDNTLIVNTKQHSYVRFSNDSKNRGIFELLLHHDNLIQKNSL